MNPAPPITSTSHGASAAASGDGDGDALIRHLLTRCDDALGADHGTAQGGTGLHDPHHDGVLHHHILTDHTTGEDDRPLDAAPGAHDRAAVDCAVAQTDAVGSTDA